jgi:hypothetical protein
MKTKKNVWRDNDKLRPKKCGNYLCLIGAYADDGNINYFFRAVGCYYVSKGMWGFSLKLDDEKYFVYAWKEISKIPKRYLKMAKNQLRIG